MDMGKLTDVKLLRVHYIAQDLEPGVLYVSEEFGAAIHLCPCGCARKVSTPLRPPRWRLEETVGGPTLHPSVGNWEFPCQSHYWIRAGKIVWSDKWTPEQIATGRRAAEARQDAYFKSVPRKRSGLLRRAWQWLMSLFD